MNVQRPSLGADVAPRPERARGDRGNVSLLIVLLLPALFVAAGLVLDGGRQIQVRREAHGHAAAAARAAVQLSPGEARAGGLNASSAVARGQAELARLGAAGSVSVEGASVVVVVTAGVDYQLLPGQGSVTQRSSATPTAGVNGGQP